MGVALGVAGAMATGAEVPLFGPLAVCEGAAATVAAAPATAEASGGSEPPLAEAWEEPSEAGASLTSLGEELLEEAGQGMEEEDRRGVHVNKSVLQAGEICGCINCSHL